MWNLVSTNINHQRLSRMALESESPQENRPQPKKSPRPSLARLGRLWLQQLRRRLRYIHE